MFDAVVASMATDTTVGACSTQSGLFGVHPALRAAMQLCGRLPPNITCLVPEPQTVLRMELKALYMLGKHSTN